MEVKEFFTKLKQHCEKNNKNCEQCCLRVFCFLAPPSINDKMIDDVCLYINQSVDRKEDLKMNFNKEEFLKTEFGIEMKKCIDLLDLCLRIEDYNRAILCQAQWEVYQMAIKQFYDIEYCFSRTDEYYGLVTENGDWLYKNYRKQVKNNESKENS